MKWRRRSDHEGHRDCWGRRESRSVVSDSLWPNGLYGPWDSPGQNTGVGSLALLQGIFPTQGIEPRFPALQADSLPDEPQGKPQNTGLGSLSLLQQIFPTQESNCSLLHCRWILYQVSYQDSPCWGRGEMLIMPCKIPWGLWSERVWGKWLI